MLGGGAYTVNEPVEVVTLVGLGPVNVLRAEGSPGEAQRGEVLPRECKQISGQESEGEQSCVEVDPILRPLDFTRISSTWLCL